MEHNPIKSDKMLSFEEFCKYFGLPLQTEYHPIGEGYLLYVFDFSNGGYVDPERYYSKEENKVCIKRNRK